MFYRNHTHGTQITTRIVTLAAGLTLGAVAIIGGSDLLNQTPRSTTGTSSVTPHVERVNPQFGTDADAVYAVNSIQPAPRFASSADAVYASLGLAYIRPQTNAATVDAGAYLGIGQPQVGTSFSTDAGAVYAMEPLFSQNGVVSSSVSPDLRDFLGTGQPD